MSITMIDGGAEFAPWLGVFETVKVIKGRPVFPQEHETELRRAADALELTMKLDLNQALSELPRRSGRWRWVVTPTETRCFFWEEATSSSEAVDLSVSTLRLGSQNWDARFKTISYLTHAQALRFAKTREVVLLNEHGQVASAARANLFWRRGSRLFTPVHEAGCRKGVVRRFVMGRLSVEEGFFSLDDLVAADEIFLTNSMRGIVSVRALEGRLMESFETAQNLRSEYEKEIAGQIRTP